MRMKIAGGFKQAPPDLKMTYQVVTGRDNHSHINVEWLTGFKRKYFLHKAPEQVNMMMQDIKQMNQIAGCEL